MPGRHFQLAAVNFPYSYQETLLCCDHDDRRSSNTLPSYLRPSGMHPTNPFHARRPKLPSHGRIAFLIRILLYASTTSTFKKALSINNKTYYRATSRAGPNVVLPSITDWLTLLAITDPSIRGWRYHPWTL